ncbi:uncharacterized protein LOC114843640 [Betta splendens]|uniref:Uncharacterized protein LOC114843640 n=1 Tax=Betta splendens TaxID=158456 RepID=A0A6P7KZT2_BETSP|nr:uncharacterized protein LOC114843640 [Betta splendens]
METLSWLWFYRKVKMLLLFVILCHGFRHVLCVEVLEGAASVVLPCHISSVPTRPTVLWSRHKLSPSTIHQRNENGDSLKDQNQCYSGRTSMKTDALQTGDLSLTLRRPRVSDSGNYSCTITAFGNERRLAEVELKVKELKTLPVDVSVLISFLLISLVAIMILGVYLWRIKTYVRRLKNKATQVAADSGVESVLLLCKTTAKLPEDVRVEWKSYYGMVHVYENGSDQPEEQNWFYRGRTEMMRNLLRTGDVSLRLKYPTHPGTFTCTVYNKEKKILMKKRVELKVEVQQVEVHSGVESVLLPCKATVHLPEDVRVEWRNRYYRAVHVYENGSDQPEEQYRFYRGRTEMKSNLLRTGDVSVRLKNPTGDDTGSFTCTIYNRERHILMRKQVELQVNDCEVEEGAESVLLPFRTGGNLPEDATVLWKRYEPEYMEVHKYQNGSDQLGDQNQFYRDRTEMKENLLETGDVSLTLKNPTVRDTGKYECKIGNNSIWRYKTVQLKVKACYQTVIYCGSTIWRLSWLWFYRKMKMLLLFVILCHERFSLWTTVLPVVVILVLVAWFLFIHVQQYFTSVQQVESGQESVLLPCKTIVNLHKDVRVEWMNRQSRTVHVHQNGSNQMIEQHSLYRGRTQIKRNLLRTGDVSLRLKNPTDKDRGTFTCTVYNNKRNILRKKQVELQVKVREVEVEEGAESVLLPFRTTGNLPEDAAVDWAFYGENPMNVHYYYNGCDCLDKLDDIYKGLNGPMQSQCGVNKASVTRRSVSLVHIFCPTNWKMSAL